MPKLVIGIEAQRIFRKKKHGMDMVALDLIRNLQQADIENEYVIFTKDDEAGGVLSETANSRIVKLASTPYPYWEQVLLPAAAKKHGVQLLHCTSNTAPLLMKMPLVLTLHDIIYLEKISYKGSTYQNMGNVYRKFIVPRVVPKARAILTVSEFEHRRIGEYFTRDASRIITVYNGVSGHFKRVTDKALLRQAAEKYKLPERFIFFLGNTDPKKNVAGVVRALDILIKRNAMPCKLVMP